MTYEEASVTLSNRVEAALGNSVQQMTPLGGGTAGDIVVKATLSNCETVVVKSSGPGRPHRLDVEARMLRTLANRSDLPVPTVLHSQPDLLIIEYIPAGGQLSNTGEEQAADLIAALHGITNDTYGLDYDNVIGGLPQSNTPETDWRRFFGEQRLLAMTAQARDAGRLNKQTTSRIDQLVGRLDRWIARPNPPSFLHGDLWGGNVLVRDGRIAGFVDPAVYYGDAEIELAYSTLFQSFSTRFYHRYGEHRPIAPGFFEERCALYNLYPLLVHVRLFGGPYKAQVERSLDKFGV